MLIHMTALFAALTNTSSRQLWFLGHSKAKRDELATQEPIYILMGWNPFLGFVKDNLKRNITMVNM